jgi:hypothetical protein
MPVSVPEVVASDELGEGAALRVHPGVVGLHTPCAEPVRGMGGKRTLEEVGGRLCSGVVQDLAVGKARVVVGRRCRWPGR